MKLLRLRLENFRQHADSDIAFEDGMTAIVGANGAGKSTVLEAITFALYGEQRDKKETIRFHFAEKKRFAVTLAFRIGDKTFEAVRSQSDAELREVGGSVRAEGLGEVTKAAERLLGLNYDQFVNSFCAEQKGLAFLHFRTSAARQEEVARMLGYDRLRRAEDLAAQRRRELGLQRETLERGLGDRAALIDARNAARERHTALGKDLAAGQKRLKALEKELRAVAERRQAAEQWLALAPAIGAAEGERGAAEAARDGAAVRRADAEAEAARFAGLGEPEAEFQRLGREVAGLERIRPAFERRTALRLECDRLADSIRRLAPPEEARDLAAAETALRKAEAAAQAWRRRAVERAAAKARLEQAEASLRLAEADLASGVCPTCGQPIRDAGAILAERRAEIEALRRPLDAGEEGAAEAAEKRLAEARASHAEAVAETARAEGLRAERERQRGRQEALERELAGFEALAYDPEAHEEIRRRRERLLPAHEEFLRLASAANRLASEREAYLAAERATLRAEEAVAALRKAQDRLGFASSVEAAEAIRAHQTRDEERVRLEAAVASGEQSLAFASEAMEQSRARLEEHDAKAAEARDLAQREALHDAAAREMRTLRVELNRTLGPDLAARASENLALLTNGRYGRIELDKNFAATVVEDGIAKPVLSGGEEDVVALSLRLALSELIQERHGEPMSLLILDEVFGSLDADRRQGVLDRLTALKGRFDQILVISHIEEINQVADRCLYLHRDPESRATVVTDGPLFDGTEGGSY